MFHGGIGRDADQTPDLERGRRPLRERHPSERIDSRGPHDPAVRAERHVSVDDLGESSVSHEPALFVGEVRSKQDQGVPRVDGENDPVGAFETSRHPWFGFVLADERDGLVGRDETRLRELEYLPGPPLE